MKWLVLVLMLASAAVLGPLLLLLTAACFLGSAAVAALMALTDAFRSAHVYNNRH